MANNQVFLIEWENYSEGKPASVSLLERKAAESRARGFRARRSRRADILPATPENLAIYRAR